MQDNNFLNHLLFLYGNLTIILDLKSQTVNAVYDGNTIIAREIDYEEFSHIFAERKGLNQASQDKMLRFIRNLNTSNEPFCLPATYEKEDKEKVVLEVKGLKYDDTHLILVICNHSADLTESHDSLTKVYTREVMIQKVKDVMKHNDQFVLMIIDIDNFKLFNDTYGHMFGDIVLVETAASIKKFLGNRGFIGRIGGDEFLVLAYVENNYDMIHNACRDIRHAITNVSNHNIKQALITATVGCASFPYDAKDYETLFRKADKALYRGKRKGRNCFIIYDESKCGRVTDEDSLEIATSFEQLYQTSTNANIVAGIFEILNRGGNAKKNIDDSLSLIGNYFLLDRIALITLQPDKKDVLEEVIEWINPRLPENKNLIHVDEHNFGVWRKSLDKTGMLKYVQLDSNRDNLELYKILKEQNTSAILAFEMKYMDKTLGLIRYDMCSINRFWQQNDVSSLMLISKIFSIYLNKEYENILHKKELFFDRLTGIYNFTKWRDEVFTFLANSEKFVKYSLIYFHIEAFMNLNDMYGTGYGDKALIAVAEGLQKIFGDNAIYCRVSEEKFLIFIPTQDRSILESKFAELNQHLEQTMRANDRFRLLGGVYIHDTMDTLTTAIDKANLARKQPLMPENGLTYFSPEFFEDGKRKAELELHMHQALKDNEFLLYLQPKINTQTGQVVGAEALTRWYFKKERLLPPNAFIPLFEQNGFITELDFKVFENVCIFLRGCLDEGIEPVKISVNVSRYQTDFDYYIETINAIREKYGIDPSLIEIEITEGMYIENIDQISQFIKKLHDCGYKISMDDFGAGYSNLSSLATLDFDLIKLDKNFCSNKENEKENIILSFVMALAKKLKMDVLCEGVETQEFAEYLKTIGCTLVQGFLFERPIPSEDFKKKYLFKKEPMLIK